MRHARITWEGALHHVMNRGLNRQKIFEFNRLKGKYIELMAEKSKKYKITIFAYCVMDNHFHICLENTSGNLSQFMKDLNGHFGQYFRVFTSSKGYVFEDRFKSTLIQDERYLSTVIRYILQNPVRSSYVANPFDYLWSSINEYFSKKRSSFISTRIVEEEFSSQAEFLKALSTNFEKKPKEQLMNNFLYYGDTLNCSKKTKIHTREELASIVRLEKDSLFNSLRKDFELDNSIKFSDINIHSNAGKKIRNRFLVHVRKESDLTYEEIQQMKYFKSLSINQLRKICHLYSKTNGMEQK